MSELRPWVRAKCAATIPASATDDIAPVGASDLSHANAFLDHVRGCDCSTCLLVARLRRAIRDASQMKEM